MDKFNIEQLIRPNILRLKPYTSARTEYKGQADILLDANENPYETGLNRYPDPLQVALKAHISQIKGLEKDHIFLGNGSDEVIDLLIRIFCVPGQDHILTLPPTYGMYKVSADVADVGVKEIPLDDDFQPVPIEVLKAETSNSKILFICHPNNPTGNAMDLDRMIHLLTHFKGIVVVDEAYIDFTNKPSVLELVKDFPNLVVMQTFSKAWGLAGIRLGMAFTSPIIVQYLNKVKPPYNINVLTQKAALQALENNQNKQDWVQELVTQRHVLQEKLIEYPFVEKIFPSDTNFLLVRVNDPNELYQYLIKQKIIVRNRSTTLNCEGCLRFTIGNPTENKRLMQALNAYQETNL